MPVTPPECPMEKKTIVNTPRVLLLVLKLLLGGRHGLGRPPRGYLGQGADDAVERDSLRPRGDPNLLGGTAGAEASHHGPVRAGDRRHLDFGAL